MKATAYKLAKLCNGRISRQSWNLWLKGERDPGLESLKVASHLLNFQLGEFTEMFVDRVDGAKEKAKPQS